MGKVISFGLDDHASRRRYDTLFKDCPYAVIQQSTYWAEAIGEIGPDFPLFLTYEEDGKAVAGLPLYLFNGPAGPILNSVPQAGPLGGIFCHPHLEEDARSIAYQALIHSAEDIAVSKNCLAMTIITNPFEPDIDLYEQYLNPTWTFENFTQIAMVDTVAKNSEFVLPGNDQRNPGRTIRKARRSGLVAGLCRDIKTFESWLEVHARRHIELGLSPLGKRLLSNLHQHLAPRGLAFLQLAFWEKEIAGGCLCVLHKNIGDAFILSMNPDHRDKSPNYLVVEQAFLEMARRGVKIFNWQSAPARKDGIYKFKRQWGSVERPYFFVTKALQPVDEILSLSREEVMKGYPGHYVLPFGALDGTGPKRRYKKGC